MSTTRATQQRWHEQVSQLNSDETKTVPPQQQQQQQQQPLYYPKYRNVTSDHNALAGTSQSFSVEYDTRPSIPSLSSRNKNPNSQRTFTTSTTMPRSFKNSTCISNVIVGSSDYLVLRNTRRGTESAATISQTASSSLQQPPVTVPAMSRLTKKLSKHKQKYPSNDFPADEITEGASTIDGSVVASTTSPSSPPPPPTTPTPAIDHHRGGGTIYTNIENENDECFDRPIHNRNYSSKIGDHHADSHYNSSTISGGRLGMKPFEASTLLLRGDDRNVVFDEMRNDHHQNESTGTGIDIDDSNENIHLIDVSRTSVSSGSGNSNDNDGSSSEQFDSNHTVAVSAHNDTTTTSSSNNCALNTTGSSSSLRTYNVSIGNNTSAQQQQHRPSYLPNINTTTNRYNHYDWSYSEETPSTREQQSPMVRNNTTNGKTNTTISNNDNLLMMDECDNSTLATVAVSNTSMTTMDTVDAATPDTSFEDGRGSGPVPIESTKKNATGTTRSTATTTTMVRSPLEHDTLVVVEGREQTLEFRHTSLILQYASIELAQHFMEYPKGGVNDTDTVQATRGASDGTTTKSPIQYLLHVKIPDANDWCLVRPFLEPHAVQTAIVTPYNLPVLLPWFQQLKLNVLLQECDLQLLYHLVTPPSPSDQVQRSSSSCIDDNRLRDDYVTVSNIILLGQVAVKAGLERTSKQAFIVASSWTKQFPIVWLRLEPQQSTNLLVDAMNLMEQCLRCTDTDDTSNLDESRDSDVSFESNDSTTWESMFEPPEASYLFSAMIAYLPTDCVEQQQLNNRRNIRELLTNQLCPYLIREGIRQHEAATAANTVAATTSSDDCNDAVLDKQQPEQDDDSPSIRNELHLIPVASADENIEMIADHETIITENLSSTSKSLLATESQRGISDNINTNSNSSVNSTTASTNPSLLQVAEEIQAGWTSLWMKLAVSATPVVAAVEREQPIKREYSNASIYHGLSHTLSDQQSEMLLLQSPKELSEWLQVVWDKLSNPPIFVKASQQRPNTSSNDVKKKKSSKRSNIDDVPQPPVQHPKIPVLDRRSNSTKRATNTSTNTGTNANCINVGIGGNGSRNNAVSSALKSKSKNMENTPPKTATTNTTSGTVTTATTASTTTATGTTTTSDDDLVTQHALSLRRTFAC